MSRNLKILWACLFLILPLLVFYLFRMTVVTVAPDTRLALADLEYAVSHSATPPVDVRWLPSRSDYLYAHEGEGELQGAAFISLWFRARLPEGATSETLQALYAHTPGANLGVYVEDRPSDTSGPFAEPLPLYLRPILIPVIQAPGDEWLYLHVAARYSTTLAPQLFFGPMQELSAVYEAQWQWRFWIPLFTASLAIAIGLMVLVFFIMRPAENYYAWFACTSVMSGLHTIWGLFDRIPLPSNWWLLLVFVLLGYAWSGMIFVHRFFRLKRRRVERAISAALVLFALPLFYWAAIDSEWLWIYGNNLWIPIIGILGLYVVSQYVYVAYATPNTETLALGLVYFVGVLLMVRDALASLVVSQDVFTGYSYGPFYGGVITLTFAFVIIRRFALTAGERDELLQDLESKVALRTQQLEETHEQLRQAERQETLYEERGRIMRDMHDGLGGQLVHAISMTEHDGGVSPLNQVLHTALDDLRLIIDSLAPDNQNLESVLASVRHRVATFAEQAGIKLNWHLSGLAAVDCGPDRSLAIIRIMQEAITNAVRHSGATKIDVFLQAEHNRLLLAVADDGTGIDDAVAPGRVGRGIVSMRLRAQELGCQLAITSGPTGTRIECWPQLTQQSQT